MSTLARQYTDCKVLALPSELGNPHRTRVPHFHSYFESSAELAAQPELGEGWLHSTVPFLFRLLYKEVLKWYGIATDIEDRKERWDRRVALQDHRNPANRSGKSHSRFVRFTLAAEVQVRNAVKVTAP